MASSVAIEPDNSISRSVAIIGSSVAAIQAALTLAQMGIEVKLVTNSASLGCDEATSGVLDNSSPREIFLWPLLLRAARHPRIKLYSSAEVESVEGEEGDFKIQVAQHPRYVHEDICTGCGHCQVECSARITSLLRGQKITHPAIHTPLLGAKAVPSAYVIDKNGLAPCQATCPLNINVQGFVSLLANGKVDKALALINEVAPLSGILGRVCKHPCENSCNRAKVDSPVSIQALHRYVADNAPGGIKYTSKFPARSRPGKIAIVGSGPAGLTAAWQLTRLGYSPTVFESHGVIGGMLATGIPRFRLPREVREREIEAIENLGIDIRTGITVGRDVTFAYLKERGYRAFFLSIGAQRNNKLNIPGEELDGVVDCMSLLLALNLKVDTFVGSNVVVIGDGNSAIDSARAANRKNEGKVKILSWTIPEEITAIKEGVKEALQEGVSIEYCTAVVEILGDGGRVTGVRCQRTRLTDEIMTNGQHKPVPIPGTDFVIAADQVVVAIGQSPNASQLNMEGLAINSNTGVIHVNPLTLETSIPGVFAGGDCVTGPNNVVEAMAAGLRAAESIDRYMQGKDLKAGRSIEPPQIAEIDIESMEVSPYKRATMPVIHRRKRISSFEETTTGLSAKVAQREAQRCLNCALCSQCMECVRVCELGATFHDDAIKHIEIRAQSILKFPSSALEGGGGQEASIEGIRTVSPGSDGELSSQVMKAMAVAMETAIEIKTRKSEETQVQDSKELGANPAPIDRVPWQSEKETNRIGVFLCRCGGGISSVIDFRATARDLLHLTGVICVEAIAQACTETGAKQIAAQATKWQLDRMVLAACRCCNSDQVCYSCTDRRIMCQQYLNQQLILPLNTLVEFVNIREQCAWVHKDNPNAATHKAVHLISAGVARVRATPSIATQKKPILPAVLIIGGGIAGITAASALAYQGYPVELLIEQNLKQGQYEIFAPCHSEHSEESRDIHDSLHETIPLTLEQLQAKGVIIKPWADALEIHGSPGNYEAMLKYGSRVDCVPAGAVLVNSGCLIHRAKSPDKSVPGEAQKLGNYMTSDDGLLSRIISRAGNSNHLASAAADLLREVTIRETTGIFLLPADDAKLAIEPTLLGLAMAARVSAYLEQRGICPRDMAVNIDSKLCRGCGNCAVICPYIEIRARDDGTVYADIDKALCLGCGTCITSCPTGAITQPLQSDRQITSALYSMLRPIQRSEV